MPGRLGDDPLSRKRPTSTKENDTPSARPGSPGEQTSHNDVFFRRRIGDSQPELGDSPDKGPSLEDTASMGEKPEITEVADIMRTAQVAKSTLGAEQLVVSVGEPVHLKAEERVEKTEQTPPTASEPVPSFEPPPPVASVSSQPEPEPQKNEGFFKRLFGRLGK